MEAIGYQANSRNLSIRDEENGEVLAHSFVESPGSVILNFISKNAGRYAVGGGVFTGCGFFMGVGLSMVAKPFLQTGDFNDHQFIYMLPAGLGLTALPIVAACYFYHKTVGEIPTRGNQAAYLAAACGEMSLAAATAFNNRT